MKSIFFLASFALIVFLSSCSKELFLFPAGTGSYSTENKTRKVADSIPEAMLCESAEESIATASSGDTQPALTPKTTPAIIKTNKTAPEQIVLNKGSRKTGIANIARLNNLKAPVNQKHLATNPKEIPDEAENNVNGTISLVCGVLGLLGFLPSLYFMLLLGLPAIIFGIISLSRQEKPKGLAFIGIGLGVLEVVMAIALVILVAMFLGKI